MPVCTVRGASVAGATHRDRRERRRRAKCVPGEIADPPPGEHVSHYTREIISLLLWLARAHVVYVSLHS